MWARSLVSFALVFAAAAGCSQAPLVIPMCTQDDAACRCSPTVDKPPVVSRNHVPVGTTVDYPFNPPDGGDHYPIWQQPWGYYPTAVRREYWVHNLEHGGIVLLYNCATGCTADVDHLRAIMTATPPDQFNEVRILITADNAMPHKFAAVAWGYRWQGDTVDEAAIRCFIGARYDKGPESIP
jgi:Protein of unknown function (DUF3105)